MLLRKTVLGTGALTLMAALALLVPQAYAHGGGYSVSGGGNPGFGGARGGGTLGQPRPGNPYPGGGDPPEPTGTTTPGRIGPPRPGGGGGFGGGARLGGGRTNARKAKAAVADGGWELWWTLNSARFLNLKARVRGAANVSDNADSFLGLVAGTDEMAGVTLRQIRLTIIPTLRRALKDPFYDTRAAAVIALGKVGDGTQPGLAEDIRGLLADPDKRVRESACLGLGLLGSRDAVADLLAIAGNTPAGRRLMGRETGDVHNRTRVFAMVGIGLIGSRQRLGESTIEALLQISAKDATRELQVGPMLALQAAKDPVAIPEVLRLFRAPQTPRTVRAQAGVALGKMSAAAAVPALREGLHDKLSEVAHSSAIALGLLTGPSERSSLNQLLRCARSASSRGTRNFSIMALGDIGGAKARGWLLERVERGSGPDQAFSALALGVMAFEDHAEVALIGRTLLKAFQETRSDVQRSAFAIGLGLAGYEPAGEVLSATLQGAGSQVLKGHVCTALGLLDHRDCVSTIRELVRQRGDPQLRQNAAVALGLLQDRGAVELLRDVIGESAASKAILGAATVALGHVGDRSAVPVLQDMVENPDRRHQDSTRAFATVALGFLGDKDELPLLTTLHESSNYLAPTDALAELLSIL